MAAVEAIDNYAFERFESTYVGGADGNTAPLRVDEEKGGKAYLKKVPPKTYAQKKLDMRRNAAKMVLIGLLFVMAFAVICVDLSGWAKGYELSRSIDAVKEEIVAAEGENVRLNNALNAMTNIAKVDEYAENELGMVKLENYQVEYIDLSQGDKIINAGESAEE